MSERPDRAKESFRTYFGPVPSTLRGGRHISKRYAWETCKKVGKLAGVPEDGWRKMHGPDGWCWRAATVKEISRARKFREEFQDPFGGNETLLISEETRLRWVLPRELWHTKIPEREHWAFEFFRLRPRFLQKPETPFRRPTTYEIFESIFLPELDLDKIHYLQRKLSRGDFHEPIWESSMKYPWSLDAVADDLPLHSYLIHCRKKGAVGKFDFKVFELSHDPDRNIIDIFYQEHGKEWELGTQFQWVYRHFKQLNDCHRMLEIFG